MNVLKVIAVVVALLIGLALSYGVLRLVGEQHKQNCIDEAQARYPAVAVTTGSVYGNRKQIVTNVNRRSVALDDCEATIF
jgi:hypothetical protein